MPLVLALSPPLYPHYMPEILKLYFYRFLVGRSTTNKAPTATIHELGKSIKKCLEVAEKFAENFPREVSDISAEEEKKVFIGFANI